jgi:hypothetical protein
MASSEVVAVILVVSAERTARLRWASRSKKETTREHAGVGKDQETHKLLHPCIRAFVCFSGVCEREAIG